MLQEILDRTGYTLDVTTGQRKYGGPPPQWDGAPPGNGCEVCVQFLKTSSLHSVDVLRVVIQFLFCRCSAERYLKIYLKMN